MLLVLDPKKRVSASEALRGSFLGKEPSAEAFARGHLEALSHGAG
eukprot:SAG31_NODE_20758_length_566_cov_0.659529_1_plen_44_part_10